MGECKCWRTATGHDLLLEIQSRLSLLPHRVTRFNESEDEICEICSAPARSSRGGCVAGSDTVLRGALLSGSPVMLDASLLRAASRVYRRHLMCYVSLPTEMMHWTLHWRRFSAASYRQHCTLPSGSSRSQADSFRERECDSPVDRLPSWYVIRSEASRLVGGVLRL